MTDPSWNLGKRYGTHDDAMAPDFYVAWLAGALRECARVCRGPIVLTPGAVNADLVPRVLAAAGRDAGRRVVLDPFAGTGSTLVASIATGRSIGLELDGSSCDVIRRHLGQR